MRETINMNMDILNVIHAVLDYKNYLHSYHVMMLHDKQFNAEAEAEKFYYGINNLPPGMNRNKSDFYRIIAYEYNHREALNELGKKEENELSRYIWK